MKCYIKDYPRPQMVRKNWLNLNGEWDFSFDDNNKGEKEGYQNGFNGQTKIRVPFTYETELSGIHDETEHKNIWYQKKVSLQREEGKRILLHFEGSDYVTKVWINGTYQGSHKGGYERFSFDITDAAVDGENLIVVKVEDSLSMRQPRGKQRWLKENFRCWYVQTTGIWKSVWMETVPEVYIKALKLTPVFDQNEIKMEVQIEHADAASAKGFCLKADISFEGKHINSAAEEIQDDLVTLKADVSDPSDLDFFCGVHRWTPEEPALYDLDLSIIDENASVVDSVGSYFGMREISIEKGNILLNGSPLYQRLILDQGYWEKSGMTAPSEEALIEDIDKIHALGYNGLRKHMKVEDERFLYWCDVKGMLVWSEMAACYEFDDIALDAFTREWLDVVKQNYSHPSIITWTPFNESWGVSRIKNDKKQQAFTESIYYLTKAIDPMRPVITNDGWEHTVSDIITLHDYEEDGAKFVERYLTHKDEITSNQIYHNGDKSAIAEGFAYHGQPIIISEYGGIAFARRGKDEWGYGSGAKNEEEFLERFQKITDAIKSIPYICGYCYTQVSDVQQEVNGLMYMDREFKISPEKIAKINLSRDASALH